MKHFAILIFLFSSICSYAQHSLTVDVKSLRNIKGTLYFSLYKSENGFPNKYENAFQNGKISSLKSTSASYTFANIPTGTYAVSLFHDEDNNGEMKTNAIGIPLEGTAASNDAKGKFGPPKFADAKISINANKKITITMWYF